MFSSNQNGCWPSLVNYGQTKDALLAALVSCYNIVLRMFRNSLQVLESGWNPGYSVICLKSHIGIMLLGGRKSMCRMKPLGSCEP